MIELDGIPYNIGGFLANTTKGYLNRTDLDLKKVPDENSFQVSWIRYSKELVHNYDLIDVLLV